MMTTIERRVFNEKINLL